MQIEHHLLFGSLCVKVGLLSFDQLVTTIRDWNARADRKSLPLADLLEASGVIGAEQKFQIQRMMAERLAEFEGDVRKTLTEVIDDESLVKLASFVGTESQEALTLLVPLKPTAADEQSATGTWNAGSTQARYRLGEETGHGGLGQVWMARDLDLNRNVALKTIKSEFTRDESIVARFLREAQITGQLEHPNVIRGSRANSRAWRFHCPKRHDSVTCLETCRC